MLPSSPRYVVPRRAVIALPPVAVAATACRWDPPWQDEVEPTEAQADADAAVVEAAAAALAGHRFLVSVASRGRAKVTGTARLWDGLMAAHLAALGQSDLQVSVDVVLPSGDADDAFRAINAHATRLQKTLADQALAATSGQLAQSLASMAAAVAQLRTGPVGSAG